MTEFTVNCPCHFGLESVLSGEIKRLGGAQDIRVSDGRVTFTGSARTVVKANLWLRTAERVQIVLGTFEARTFTELFDNTAELPFEKFFGPLDAFPVKGRTVDSALFSMSDCQSIIKKAVVTRMQKFHDIEYFEETGTVYQLTFFILKDRVSIMLDSTGTGLHKRGYREISVDAPIKETLAAGIVDLAGVRNCAAVCDPFCGSGTFIIEAALQARKTAPGLLRTFAGEGWKFLPQELWEEERELARKSVKTDSKFRGYGSDIEPDAVALSENNAAKAGVDDCTVFALGDFKDFVPPAPDAVVICNPPYGERMSDIESARKIYAAMGKFHRKYPGVKLFVITSDEEFEARFGHKATKRRKLYNGMIKCQLYMYEKK